MEHLHKRVKSHPGMHFTSIRQFVEISTQLGKFRSYFISKAVLQGLMNPARFLNTVHKDIFYG